jgi:hypothetical protein
VLCREIEELTAALNGSIGARDGLAASIDEVLAAAEGLRRDMVESPRVAAAVRYAHAAGQAVGHFCGKSYLTLVHMYFHQLRRRVRRQGRIRAFYRTRRATLALSRLRTCLGGWVAYTAREARLSQAARWVQRGALARCLGAWRERYALERAVAAGAAANMRLRTRQAVTALLRNAAAARRDQRLSARNAQLCRRFSLGGCFRTWTRYLARISLPPLEEQALTARAAAHRGRVLLAAWRQAALLGRAETQSRLLPCERAIERARLGASLRAWRGAWAAGRHLRRRRHVAGFGALLREIIAGGIQHAAARTAGDYLLLARLRPALLHLRDWTRRQARENGIGAVVSSTYRRRVFGETLRGWRLAFGLSRRRRQEAHAREGVREARELEAGSQAMAHYLARLLRAALRDWARAARQLRSLRLIQQAEAELRAATEAFDRLTAQKALQRASSGSGGSGGDAFAGVSDPKAATSIDKNRDNNGSGSSSSRRGKRGGKSRKGEWVLSLDLVSSDDGGGGGDGDGDGGVYATQSYGGGGYGGAGQWGSRELANAVTTELKYRQTSAQDTVAVLSSTETATGGMRRSAVVVHEYTHASHFEVRFRAVLRRLATHAKRAKHYTYCAERVAVGSRRRYLGGALGAMLALWGRAALRKVAAVRVYAASKQSGQLACFDLRAAVAADRQALGGLKAQLEEARAQLADRQVDRYTCIYMLHVYMCVYIGQQPCWAMRGMI